MYQGRVQRGSRCSGDPVTSFEFQGSTTKSRIGGSETNQHSKKTLRAELTNEPLQITHWPVGYTHRTEPEYGEDFEKWILKQYLELGWNLQPESNQVK